MKNLFFLLSFLFISVSEVYADENVYSLAVHESTNLNSMWNSIKLIESQGGRIIHIFPPHILIGNIPTNISPKDVGIRNIYQGMINPLEIEDLGEDVISLINVWNLRFKKILKARPPQVDPGPIKNDCIIWKPKKKSLDRNVYKTPPYGASFYDTSEYMIGKIAVGIILPESTGRVEDWTATEEAEVISEITAACDWWANKEPKAYISFTYKIHKKIPTRYEPIQLRHTDERSWIPETIDHIHTNSYNEYIDKVISYNNHLRDTYHTHWSFTIFVVDSSNDSDGMFTDGYFAYAYLGGPLMVMTYKNNNYGIENMDAVCAHEIGHIFYALDEYSDAGSSANDRSGYLNVVNGNFEVGGIINVSCIMRGGISPYTDGVVCRYTRGQLGWQDSDNNYILDIVDRFPITSLQPFTPNPTTNYTPTYHGTVIINPYPNNNPNGHGNNISINSITNVQYRINNGDWRDALAKDGAFDETTEEFYFTTPPLSIRTHLIEVRAANSCGTLTQVNIQQYPYPSDRLTITSSLISLGSQTITGSVLKIAMFDDGAMGIWKKDGNRWIRHIYGDNSKGSVIFLDGTNSNYRYTSRANTFFKEPHFFTPISNTMVGSFTIITVYKAETTGIEIKQITTYIDGADYYKMEWQITNNSTNTYNDIRFFHGGNTYFAGNDKGYGHWNNNLNMVYVTSSSPTQSGFMGLYGGTLTPATSYYEDTSGNVFNQVKLGLLPDTVNTTEHDTAYVLSWQIVSLAPGQTWKIIAYERITYTGGVIILAPQDQESPPENTLEYYFTVYNNEIDTHTFNLLTSSSNLWTIQIFDMADNPINSVTIDSEKSAMVKVLLSVPKTAKAGMVDLLTFIATSQTNPLITGTTTIITTVIPDVLNYIKIDPPSITIDVSKSSNFTAQGYDKYGNPIPNLTYNWTMSDNIGFISPLIGSVTSFTAGITPCIGTIYTSIGDIIGTATVKIIPSGLAYIQIIPNSVTLSVEEGIKFSAQGYDKYHNLIPNIEYNWYSGDIGKVSPTIGSSTLFTAGTKSGTCKIIATSNGKNAFASIIITPGPLHHIEILPPIKIVSVLGTCRFQAQGYDKFNNPISGLLYEWAVGIGTITAKSGSTTTFIAGTVATSTQLTVAVGTITQIATITIISGFVYRLAIIPPLGTITVAHDKEFSVFGYDQFDNPIIDLPYFWDVDEILGTVTPQFGSVTLFIAGTKAQTGTISVTVDSIIAIATITLIPDSIDHLIITPDMATVSITTQQEFYVEGYDRYNNYVPHLDYTWQIHPGLGEITPSIGTRTIFTGSTTLQTGSLTVTFGNITQIATITLIPGHLQYLIITPSLATVTVNSSQEFSVQGYDQFSNPILELDYLWQAVGGGVVPTYGTTTTFKAGTKAIIATLTVTSATITQEAYVTITPDELFRLEIIPQDRNIQVNKKGTFTVIGYDKYDNPISDILCHWYVPMVLGKVNPTFGTSTTLTAGSKITSGIIQVTYGETVGTATIQLIPVELDHFEFELIPHQVGNTPFFATITAKDAYDNLVNFSGKVNISGAPLVATGKFEAGIWVGTITINKVALDIQLVATYGNIRGISNPFASLIDDNYGTITLATNTTLITTPKALKGNNYYIIIDTNPKSTNIDIANIQADQEPRLDRVPNSIRDIRIVDGDRNQLKYEFGNTTTLAIPYQDNDNDGIVDGTNILEKSLKMYILDDNRWMEVDVTPIIDPIGNLVRSPIFRIGIYTLMGYSLQPNLTNLIVYPVPFKPQRGDLEITFEGLSKDCSIRIYDIAGNLKYFEKHLDGCWHWNVTDDGGRPLESGVYIYIITDNKGEKKTGKIVIIR